jgi:hypothetical protein
MDVIQVVAQAWTVMLTVAFALAVAHKVELLTTHTAKDQPLAQLAPWRSLGQERVVAAVAVCELAIIVIAVMDPIIGLGAAVLLLAAYASQLRRLGDGLTECGCFGLSWLDAVVDPVRRNLVLLVVTVMVLAISIVRGAANLAFTEAMTAALILVTAAGLALQALHRTKTSAVRRYST